MKVLLLSALLSTSSLAAPTAGSGAFPVIDLGYAKHAPTIVNTTENGITYATYANIRFAQPPKGANRFKKPQLPPPRSDEIQDGVVPPNSTDCQIYLPPYLNIAPGLNGTSWGSEDCLFLDVKIPEGVKKGDKVPVLHWIYGGGYTFGSKNNWAGDPAALSYDMPPGEKFITVSSNYRLGPLGWISSETEPDMDPNVGLWDALVALNWTRQYISRFGGNPDDITAIGESAGGASIQHLITAHGGKGDPPPFKKAIITSPGYRPHVNRSEAMTALYRDMLKVANCTDLACLRGLSEEQMMQVNIELYSIPDKGWLGPEIGYGPIPDGDLVPDYPDRLMQQGRYHRSVEKVMTANMALDGVAGTVGHPETWEQQLGYYMASPSPHTVELAESIYGENVTIGADTFNKDAIFACHAYFTAAAYASCSSEGLESYRYEMSIPPAYHGQDQFYYFYHGGNISTVTEPERARELQRYIREFLFEGGPGKGDGGRATMVEWPAYGKQQQWMNITADGFEVVEGEDEQRRRCEALMGMIEDEANGW